MNIPVGTQVTVVLVDGTQRVEGTLLATDEIGITILKYADRSTRKISFFFPWRGVASVFWS